MTGLDRERREVQVAPSFDDEGREVTPQRALRLRHAGDRASAARATTSARRASREHAMKLESQADARRFHARMVNACIRAHAQADAAAARAVEGGDHRRRRDRRRAGRRAAPHDARGRRLRAGPRRSRQGHQGHADRGRRPRAAGAAAATVAGHRGAAAQARRRGAHQRARSPRCCATACGWPTAACSPPSWWCGPPASRRRTS